MAEHSRRIKHMHCLSNWVFIRSGVRLSFVSKSPFIPRLLSGMLFYFVGFWAPIMLPSSPKRIHFLRGLFNSLDTIQQVHLRSQAQAMEMLEVHTISGKEAS